MNDDEHLPGSLEFNSNEDELDSLPPEIKKVVEMGFSMQRLSTPISNPVFSKITEEHISRIIEIGNKEEDNSYKDSQSNKFYNFLYFIVGIALFVFLIVYLGKENKDLFLEVLKIGIAIVGGFGGGFGYKTYLERKNK